MSVPKAELLGDVEGPTQLEVKHPHARVQYLNIESVGSMLSTDICIGHLDHAYGEDLGREIWPIRKGNLT
jgi:hypothetical protein